MNRQTSIIYTTDPPECWTNLKKFCREKGLKYNTVSKKKLPIEFDGAMIYRVKNQ